MIKTVYHSKIIFMGTVGVGKTTAITAICNRDISTRSINDLTVMKTPRSTIYMDRFDKYVEMSSTSNKLKFTTHNNNEIDNGYRDIKFIHKLSFWDTCGMERFNSIPETFMRDTTHLVLMFDLTDEFPVKYANNIVNKAKKFKINKKHIILVGNKTDSKNKHISCLNHINTFGRINGMKTVFCSAKNLDNIDCLLKNIILISESMRNIISSQKPPLLSENKLVINSSNCYCSL